MGYLIKENTLYKYSFPGRPKKFKNYDDGLAISDWQLGIFISLTQEFFRNKNLPIHLLHYIDQQRDIYPLFSVGH